MDDTGPELQRAYRDSISHINVQEILALPHLGSLKSEWEEAFKKELKDSRKSEANINNLRKNKKRSAPNP